MIAETKTRENKYLEGTMRDVLDGLEDAASYMNYHSVAGTFEILCIEPPGRSIPLHTEIIPFNKINSVNSKQNTNIVDYLIQRELKKSA